VLLHRTSKKENADVAASNVGALSLPGGLYLTATPPLLARRSSAHWQHNGDTAAGKRWARKRSHGLPSWACACLRVPRPRRYQTIDRHSASLKASLWSAACPIDPIASGENATPDLLERDIGAARHPYPPRPAVRSKATMMTTHDVAMRPTNRRQRGGHSRPVWPPVVSGWTP
jgi:hypothetical protein